MYDRVKVNKMQIALEHFQGAKFRSKTCCCSTNFHIQLDDNINFQFRFGSLLEIFNLT